MTDGRFERVCDDIVTYMALARAERSRSDIRDLRIFDGAEVVDVSAEAKRDDEADIFSFAVPSDLSDPLNYGCVVPSGSSGDFGRYTLCHLRGLSARERRGLPSAVDLAKMKLVLVEDSGEFRGVDMVVGRLKRHKIDWHRWLPKLGRWEAFDKEISEKTRLMIGLQFASRYRWHVRIGFNDNPSVSFRTDPIGARAVFKLRDIPNGASRRSALVHWVTEHWRRSRSDESEERFVRAHFSGRQDFVWNGLRCSIIPSRFDRDQERKHAANRAFMRDHGSDVRALGEHL